MFVRLVIALLSSPWHGLIASLAALPVALAFGVALLLLASGAQAMAAGPQGGMIALLMTVVIFVTGLIAYVAVTVQQVRYAGSFSGAAKIRTQPRFITAFWRGMGILVLLVVLLMLVFVGIGLLAGQLWQQWGLPAPDPVEIQGWVERMTLYLAGNPGGDPAVAEVGLAVEGLRFVGFALTVVTAMLLVPRCCGVGRDAGRAWSFGLILYRFLIATPCLALLTLIAASAIVMGLEVVSGGWLEPFVVAMTFNLQAWLFAGVAYSHEAHMLKAAREVRNEARETLRALEAELDEDPRALRARWSES